MSRGRGLVFGMVGLIGVVVVVAVASVGVAMLLLTHHSTWPLEAEFADAAVGLTTRLRAGNQENPQAGNRRALQAGQYAFTGSCAICHGAKGDGKGQWGNTLFPPATDLTGEDSREKSDAALFWIIKNGLSFTGMPGFADQYSDEAIWDLVVYIRSLQNGGPSAYEIPTPTEEQLAMADPHGNTAQVGAALYYAQGCQTCHGAVGNGPGELAIRRLRPDAAQTIRQGRAGMPAYGMSQMSDEDIQAVVAYLQTFAVAGTRPIPQ